VILLPVMPFKLAIFRYNCIIANFAKDFLNQQDRQWALRQLLSSEPCNHIVETFGSFGLPGIFYQTLLLNIVPWDNDIFYQCCPLT